MNNYDFSKLLSPSRFEQISRDLFTSKYGIFENFAAGKDSGIDFRYSKSKSNILIIQCKRYSNVQSLISALKKESKKAKDLIFNEYLLILSLNLTPKRKNEIVKIYNGIIKNPNQIVTNKDLNYLLSLNSNKSIEFKYPELWMNSIIVTPIFPTSDIIEKY